jgi:hypothetical protein
VRKSLFAAFALATLSLTQLAVKSARADVKIAVSYDYVETEVSPRQQTHRSHTSELFTLSGENSLSFNNNNNGESLSTRLRKNKDYVSAYGEEKTTSFRIKSGAIQILSNRPGRTVVTRIKTNGKDSCRATVEYLKKPGHEFFESPRKSNHELMSDSDQHSENVTCTISAG